MNKSNVNNESESSEAHEMCQATQFAIQNQQTGFMVRSGNQNYRFQGPQNFIHQQPPPITQGSQFSGQRGQIMSNSSMSMYQTVGQSQMMQPPPPVTTTHQFIQQDMNVYQQNSNFHTSGQQGNINRFNAPQQQHQGTMSGDMNNGMMTGNQQQQPRFRQW